MSCSPGRPVFGEDLPSSSGPPTPFRNLPTSSSSPPPFSPFKPCSRQSSSSDTDLSLTPKTGKNTLPIPLLHSHHSVLLTPTSGAAMVMVFVYFVYSYLIPCLFTLDFLFFVHFFFYCEFCCECLFSHTLLPICPQWPGVSFSLAVRKVYLQCEDAPDLCFSFSYTYFVVLEALCLKRGLFMI